MSVNNCCYLWHLVLRWPVPWLVLLGKYKQKLVIFGPGTQLWEWFGVEQHVRYKLLSRNLVRDPVKFSYENYSDPKWSLMCTYNTTNIRYTYNKIIKSKSYIMRISLSWQSFKTCSDTFSIMSLVFLHWSDCLLWRYSI